MRIVAREEFRIGEVNVSWFDNRAQALRDLSLNIAEAPQVR
jgi:hypothetical protein